MNKLNRFVYFLGVLFIPFSNNLDYSIISENYMKSGWTNGITINLSDLFYIFLLIYYISHNCSLDKRKKNILYYLPIIILFLVSMIISVKYATWRMYCYFEIVQYVKNIILYYYVTVIVIENKEDLHYAFYCINISLFLQVSFGIIQFIFQDYYNIFKTGLPIRLTDFENYIRSCGTLGQPNSYASFIVPALLINFAVLKKSINNLKYFYSLIFVFGIIALIFSFSRAGWLSYLIGTTFLLFFNGNPKFLTNKNMVYFLGLLLIIIIFYPFIQERLFINDGGAAEDRLHLNRIAFEIIKNNYILGVGINNYWFTMWKSIPANYDWPYVYLVHNLFLYVFAETGVLGFISVLLIFFMPFKNLLYIARNKQDNDIAAYCAGICAAIIALFLQNMVDITWASQSINSFYLILIGLGTSMMNIKQNSDYELVV